MSHYFLNFTNLNSWLTEKTLIRLININIYFSNNQILNKNQLHRKQPNPWCIFLTLWSTSFFSELLNTEEPQYPQFRAGRNTPRSSVTWRGVTCFFRLSTSCQNTEGSVIVCWLANITGIVSNDLSFIPRASLKSDEVTASLRDEDAFKYEARCVLWLSWSNVC